MFVEKFRGEERIYEKTVTLRGGIGGIGGRGGQGNIFTRDPLRLD